MRKSIKVVGALTVAGLIAVSSSAFTHGGSLPGASGTKSYASQSIVGVTAQSIAYITDTPGEFYTEVDLVLTGNTTAKVIKIAFNDAAPVTCSDAGTFTTTTAYACVLTPDVDVNLATKFALVAN